MISVVSGTTILVALVVGLALQAEQEKEYTITHYNVVKDKYGEEWLLFKYGTAEYLIRFKTINAVYSGEGTGGRDMVFFAGGKISIHLERAPFTEHFFPGVAEDPFVNTGEEK